MPTRSRIRILTLLAVVGAALAVVSGAQAGCTGGGSQPFKQWGDLNYYDAFANGGFETQGSSWTFGGGGGIVTGNESFFLGRSSDARSASLPAGATVTSKPFCVSASTPISRFMLTTSSGSAATLRVDLLCPGAVVTVANLTGTGAWSPSPQVPMLACLPAGSATVNVQLRVAAVSGSWQVDDFFLDPYKKH